LSDPVVTRIAEKHEVLPPSNVLIAYHICQGVVPLVKSTSPSWLKSIHQTVSLGDEDLKTLNKLSEQPGKH
jgi:diketogulonate reductase-like aldo/keto reductase